MSATLTEPQAVPSDTSAAENALRRFDVGILVFVLGMTATLGTSVWVFLTFASCRAAVDRYGWGQVPAEAMPSFAVFEQWGTLIDICNAALYGIGFLIAMYQARRLGEAIGAGDYQYSYGWTIGSMFIPIVCLFRPWLGFAEIRRTLYNAANSGRPSMKDGFSTFTLVLALTVLIGLGGSKGIEGEFAHVTTPVDSASFYQYIAEINILIVSASVVIGGMLAIMLVYLLTLRSRSAVLVMRARGTSPIQAVSIAR